MAFTWTNKTDDVDIVLASDINSIGQEVANISSQLDGLDSTLATIAIKQSEIISVQNSLIGGESA